MCVNELSIMMPSLQIQLILVRPYELLFTSSELTRPEVHILMNLPYGRNKHLTCPVDSLNLFGNLHQERQHFDVIDVIQC